MAVSDELREYAEGTPHKQYPYLRPVPCDVLRGWADRLEAAADADPVPEHERNVDVLTVRGVIAELRGWAGKRKGNRNVPAEQLLELAQELDGAGLEAEPASPPEVSPELLAELLLSSLGQIVDHPDRWITEFWRRGEKRTDVGAELAARCTMAMAQAAATRELADEVRQLREALVYELGELAHKLSN